MNTSGTSKLSKNLEEETEISKETRKFLGQPFAGAVPMQFENESSDEQLSAVASDGMQDSVTNSMEVATVDKDKQFDVCSLDGAEDHKISLFSVVGKNSSYERLDVGSTPEANCQITYSMQHSPASGILSQDLSVSSAPWVQRGLDNCITAPVGTRRNLFFESHENALSRSMTEKREIPRHDLKLDRLLEHKKDKML